MSQRPALISQPAPVKYSTGALGAGQAKSPGLRCAPTIHAHGPTGEMIYPSGP